MQTYNLIDWDSMFDADIRYWQIPDAFLDNILAHIPKSSSIVDIGCGRGELIQQLIQRKKNVHGIDMSHQALQIARQHCPSGSFKQSDIERDSIDGEYDAAFLKLSLSFVDDKKAVLEKISVCAPVVVIITPVLFDGGKYSAKARRIGIYSDEIERLLGSIFNSYELFSVVNEVSGPRLSVYICYSLEPS